MSGLLTGGGGGGGGAPALAISVKVAPYNAVGNGVADDTAAVTAAITAAAASGAPVYFPPGTYLLTNQGGAIPKCVSIPISTPSMRLIGDRAIVKFDSSASHCFRVNGTCPQFSMEGITFQGFTGTGFDNYTVNAFAAVYVFAGDTDVTIERCQFLSTQAAFFASDDASGNRSQRLLFQGNYLKDSLVSVAGGPAHAKIIDNWFERTTPTLTQSHAVYVFGNAENVMIRGNTFLRHGDATIEIRASTASYQSKRNYLITDNTFIDETQYSTFLSTQASESNLGTMVFSNNTFHNAGGIFCIGMRDATFNNNVFTWDYAFRTVNAAGITVIANIGGGSQCIPEGNVISGNRFVNQHPFWAVATIASQPADGDTITIGNVTYRWKTTPAAAADVQLNANINTCAQNLAYAIQGRTVGAGAQATNVLLRDLTDVWYSNGVAEGKVWVASYKTFAFSRTGTAVSVSTVTNATLNVLYSVNLANNIAPVVTGNSMKGCTMSLSDNIDPYVGYNTFTPGPEAVGPQFHGNVFPVYDSNRVLFDRALATVQLLSADYWNTYDAFPVFRDNGQPIDMTLFAANKTPPWLQGAAGWVNAGNGKAKMVMFYGNETGTLDDPAGRPFQWNNGDQVSLYKDVTPYIFTFKRTGPNGTTEFNSHATLMALINTQTGGFFTATNPVVVLSGSDSLGYGYIEIEASVVGTARNTDSLGIVQNNTTRRGSRTCGVYLRPWVENGLYPGGVYTPFVAGAATATKTVVFTPLASKNTPVIVQGLDAASHALDPVVYQADVIPGVCFVISHAAAVGTEKFFWRLA